MGDTSIVIACHNCAHAFRQSLPKLYENTRGVYDILILLDQTNDDSLFVVQEFTFQRVQIFKTSQPYYEARAESFLMSVSKASKYIISVQPDHLIHEYAWNEKMALPFL